MNEMQDAIIVLIIMGLAIWTIIKFLTDGGYK